MQAAGLLTAASAIPVPTDLGALTGTVSITLVEAPAFFRPGRHDLVWRGENEAGQEVFVTQRFDLHPVVSLSIDRVVAEGARTSFSVMLNGPSPVDGLTVPFTVGGQAGPSDHDLVSGTVVFGRGEVEKVVAFQVYEDVVAEGTETIEISIEGVRREIRIVESNLAPRVAIDTLQGGLHTRVFHRTSGAVALASSVEDSNPKDRVTVSYVYPSGDRIDPATMPAGVYPLGVTALDNGAPARSTRFDWWFRVVDLVPDLAADRDTDGDGLDDLAEGFEDPDLDGVPAYLDAWALPHALAVGPAPQHVVDASPGVHLELGPDALLAGHGRLDANAFPADANAVPGAGYVDLIAEVANAGQAARLVVPLVAPLAANQVVRVLDANDRWGTLPATAIASAPLVQGACPAATNAAYRDGLHAGDACLCIALVDGAAHDRDGRANQRVALVVGLGVEAVSTSSGGGSDASVEGTTESENAAPGVQASAKSGESASVEGGAGCTCVTTRMPAAWWVTVFAGALLLLRWAFERRRLARASVRSTRRM